MDTDFFGVIAALLCFLQIVHSACLWIFSVPGLISMHKSLDDLKIPKANPLVYGGFSFLVIIVAILTAINFFVSPYKSMWNLIGGNSQGFVLIFLAVLVPSNMARLAVMKQFIKE